MFYQQANARLKEWMNEAEVLAALTWQRRRVGRHHKTQLLCPQAATSRMTFKIGSELDADSIYRTNLINSLW